MIQAPNRYAPERNPEAGKARRDLVLAQMLDQKRIQLEEAERARAEPLPRKVFPRESEVSKWFRDYAVRYVPADLPNRGMAVHTTLDLTLQEMAERAVRNATARLDLDGEEAALVALDPRTGEVLALVGGRSYASSQFNRATSALRQPGSAFKPIVAATALEPSPGGFPTYTLASLLEDAPLFVPTSNGPWQPANYDGRYRGLVTLRRAIEQSLNVPFARLGVLLGPSRIVETAHRFGIGTKLRAVPSLALGTSEVTLLELTRSYGVFAANGGLAATQLFFRPSHYGEAAQPFPPQVREVLDPRVAYLVTSTLEGVVLRGTARALQSSRFGSIAGKTGTSSDWRDAWFIAYTPALVVGAWIGYDDGRSLRLTGARAALPIVEEFLNRVAPYLPNERFVEPGGISEALVQVNLEWPWECGRRELFLAGTEPPRPARTCFQLDLPGF
jgi:penicillin-binding protein 1B